MMVECSSMDFSVFIKKYVKCTNLHSVHRHGSEIVWILLVPAQPQEGVVLWVFVDDGGVLQVTQVKHSYRTVST